MTSVKGPRGSLQEQRLVSHSQWIAQHVLLINKWLKPGERFLEMCCGAPSPSSFFLLIVVAGDIDEDTGRKAMMSEGDMKLGGEVNMFRI
jgi:hypothetical protein